MKMDWTAPGRDKAKVGEVAFKCDVAQIKTMADGGYRLVLDLGEQDAGAVSLLLPSVKRTIFQVAMIPIKEE